MVTWADADAAVEAERALRIKRVENATLVSALTLLLCAVWLAWPSIRGLSATATGSSSQVLVHRSSCSFGVSSFKT